MMASVALTGWLLVAVCVHRVLLARERVARACHEVRGPLTAAALALQLMERRAEAPAARITALDEQLRRAQLALEDLGCRRGAPDRLERVSVAALLAAVDLCWGPVCAAKGRPLAVGSAPSGLSVLADRTRLSQALGNLIANALEHGAGEIALRPRVSGSALRLEVRDEGGGLDRPLAHVMRPRRGGRGRGLSIAAAIASRHGGALSTAPGGAVVFELPLLPAWVLTGEAAR